jgi:mxaA protein
LLLLALSSLPAAAAPSLTVHLETPRPYGYLIGDTIALAVTVETPSGLKLDEAALPRPGAVNRWLELRRVEAKPQAGGGYRLSLEYQTFHAPLTVKTLTIPGFRVNFAGGTTAEVPPWSFSAAPIKDLAVLSGEGQQPLRPDAPPPLLPLAASRAATLAAAGLALLALAWLAYLRGLLPYWSKGRHYAAALRTLRRLARQPQDEAARRLAFTAVHRAFNQTLGQPLFAEQLDDFFLAQAHYVPLREDIEAFFAASYVLFFGSGAPPTSYPLERLAALCRQCLQIERARP